LLLKPTAQSEGLDQRLPKFPEECPELCKLQGFDTKMNSKQNPESSYDLITDLNTSTSLSDLKL